jgi:uncharacterized protein (TIGR00661 family)
VKYLFIVQGEGRGHLTQALATRELLAREGHEVTGMLVGKARAAVLPAFFVERAGCPVETFDSVYFLFSRAGRRALFFKTILHHACRAFRYIKSVSFIRHRVAASGADAVINFYEVIAGVTFALSRPRLPVYCVAHQYLFLHPGFVFPAGCRWLELRSLLFFTRLTGARATRLLALSFREMPAAGRLRVIPPRLRREVTRMETGDDGFILGYLLDAGFAGQVIDWHRRHPGVPLHFFWNKPGAPRETTVDDTLTFHQLDGVTFLRRMARCRGYASTGGFESVCEAMYARKPVMMVPAHVEQECNAFDAARAGAGIVSRDFNLSALLDYIPRHAGNEAFIAWADRADELLLEGLTR